MEKWEYKIINISVGGWISIGLDPGKTQKELNKLGNDGWELVSTLPITQAYGKGSRTHRVNFIFKRKIQD